jgi:hypothetical protein
VPGLGEQHGGSAAFIRPGPARRLRRCRSLGPSTQSIRVDPNQRSSQSDDVIASVDLKEPTDWQKLQGLQATVVLDPTAVRAAELFAGGRSKANEATWQVIRGQLTSLATFVDCLVLYPRIPLFDYQLTYVRSTGEVLGDLQVCGDVLVPVRVFGNAGDSLRVSAAKAMHEAASLPSSVATRIAADLKALDWRYEWKGASPGDDLSGTRTAGDPSGDIKVNSFLYIALLYARYAQQIDGLNVVPPALSAQQIRASLETDDSGLGEAALFTELAQIWNATPDGVKRTLTLEQPSFLPYLLTFRDATPTQLFERALQLRNQRDVRPYSKWLLEARNELANGNLSSKRRKQVRDAAAVLTRRLRERCPDLPVTIGLQSAIDANFIPTPSAAVTVNAAAFRDWVLSLMPGLRYQKLLLRLATAQLDKIAIDRQLRKLWDAA